MPFLSSLMGFRSWRRPPLLLLCDAKAPNYRKNKAFKDLGHYSEWPKVADAVIESRIRIIAGRARVPDGDRL
mgnify:CR=1 FL=1